MTQTPSRLENLISQDVGKNIRFQSALITPVELAKKLNEDKDFLLKELKDEKGIFEDTMTSESILAWDTVQRACERRGIMATKTTDPTLQPKDKENTNDMKLSLSKEEKRVLQYCRDFHKEYSTLIEKSLPVGLEAKSELSEYHKSISNSITSVLNKIEGKKTKKQSVSIESFDEFDLNNP